MRNLYLAKEELLLAGLLLSSTETGPLMDALRPEWSSLCAQPLQIKWEAFEPDKALQSIYPFPDLLSGQIDRERFIEGQLIQPHLFLRIRPGKEKAVLSTLNSHSIPYERIGSSTISLTNTTPVNEPLRIDQDVVVQDYSSQRVAEMFHLIDRPKDRRLKVWDCCAASGGKSILVNDLLGLIDLTVSDIRKNILRNLQQRLATAEVPIEDMLQADLTNQNAFPSNALYDFIVADVPCTGSGTWSRTPEQVIYFDITSVEQYVSKQRAIVQNCIPLLQTGGYLLYITCSVFAKENEEQADFFRSIPGLDLLQANYFEGATYGADTLYAALFQKNR